mmetsp:Transcript_141998/g.247524  ORF Transcript_141998/g.247524 Transcript_141998/m.247524 type:complete len:109 (-) Transcript_141998:1651-1977(-)
MLGSRMSRRATLTAPLRAEKAAYARKMPLNQQTSETRRIGGTSQDYQQAALQSPTDGAGAECRAHSAPVPQFRTIYLRGLAVSVCLGLSAVFLSQLPWSNSGRMRFPG